MRIIYLAIIGFMGFDMVKHVVEILLLIDNGLVSRSNEDIRRVTIKSLFVKTEMNLNNIRFMCYFLATNIMLGICGTLNIPQNIEQSH